MRKFTLVAITFAVFIAVTLQHTKVQTNAVQPQSARTGAPGEKTCGDDATCHNTVPNTFGGNVSIAFSDPDSLYIPGDTYTVTVTVTDAAQQKFGFEITSLDSANLQAGSFAEITGSTDLSFPIAFNGRLYAAHHNASGNNIFNIAWTAPLTDVGKVTFYASGNAANGNGLNTGDHVYTSSFTVDADNSSGTTEIFTAGNFTVQSLISGQLFFQYDVPNSDPVSIYIFNVHGQPVKVFHSDVNSAQNMQSIDVSDISPGLYIVQVCSGQFSQAKKVIIQ